MHCAPSIKDWAASTTALWSEEVKAEMRLQRRRECISRCRAKTKLKLEQMHLERGELETQVKQRLAALNGAKTAGKSVSNEVCQLALESDALRTEALELRDRLQQYRRCWSLVSEATDDFGLFPEEPSNALTVREASKVSKWVLSPQLDASGWQVCLPNGSPSFYFHPFTRPEYDGILDRCDDALLANPPQIEVAGSLFGWTVHRAPLTRILDGGGLVARTRFTTRVSCPMDVLDAAIVGSPLEEWPLLATPPKWSPNDRKQTCCQVLQEFETDSYVLVHDIPGPLRFRYTSLIRRLPRTLRSGQRSITFASVIADSEANTRKCVTEQPHDDIEWIKEGGSYISFTEVNATTVDVRYDHWASCHDELHARHLFVRWAEFASDWSQRMAPRNLLAS